MSIPATAHFVWLGAELAWLLEAAPRSAAVKGGYRSVCLHHTGDLSSGPWRRRLEADGVQCRQLDVPGLLAGLVGPGTDLLDLYTGLSSLAAKVNILRAALLFREGGVYADMDTVTVAPMGALLDNAAFAGLERIVYPHFVARSRSPVTWLMAKAKSTVRTAFKYMPRGYRHFRRIEQAYHLAANNAVLGAEPGHPFLQRLLERMVSLPPGRQSQPHALGTHLLQQSLAEGDGRDIVLLEPATFYPLPPVIAEHWFRLRSMPELSDIIAPQTRLIHWYASERNQSLVGTVNAAYVRKNASRQLLSALLLPYAEPSDHAN